MKEQSNTIETRTRQIIDKFVSSKNHPIFDIKANIELAASLYRLKEEGGAKKGHVLSILKDYLVDFDGILSEEEVLNLLENYQQVIFYVLDSLIDGSASIGNGIYTQPKELAYLCLHLAALPEGSRVYNPFAGMCSYSRFSPDLEMHGEEIHRESWAISQILLDAQGSNANITLGDSFAELHNKDNSYDGVIMTPPFQMRGVDNELSAIRYAIENKLKNGGILVTVLPSSFMSSPAHEETELREYLVRNGFIRGVISLPKMFIGTSIQICVLVAQKKSANNFMLIDGRDFVSKADNYRLTPVFLTDSLIESISAQNENYCKILTSAELQDGNNLQPSRYLIDLPALESNQEIYKIGDLIEIYNFPRVDSRTLNIKGYNIIRSANLSTDYIKCQINPSKYEPSQHFVGKIIDKKCILVYCVGDGIKVGVFVPDGQETLYHNEMFCFNLTEIGSKVVTQEYFLKMILSDYVHKQVMALQTGVTIPRLSHEDFRSIRIPVECMDAQKQIVEKDYKGAISEGEKKLEYALNNYKEDIRMKKHAMGQHMRTLGSWMTILNYYLESSDGKIDINKTIDMKPPITFLEIIKLIGNQVDILGSDVSKFTASESESGEAKMVNLHEFLKEYADIHRDPRFKWDPIENEKDAYASEDLPDIEENEDGSFSVKKGHYIIRKGDPIFYAKVDAKALTIILDDIVSNACEHGFVGEGDFRIKISWQLDDDDIVIKVANNGLPINEFMTEHRILAYGESTSLGHNGHSGIGGYQIKKIIEQYKGSIKISNDIYSEYPVTYKISLPSNIISSL